MSGSFNQDAKGHSYLNVTAELRVATLATLPDAAMSGAAVLRQQ
jgi:hypothetical protein